MPAPRKRSERASLPWASATSQLTMALSVPDWHEKARCAEVDPELFFPEKGGSTREAKKVCMSCEARTECLDWAIDSDEQFGILGGKSERERRAIGRERVAAAKQAAPMEATA